MDGKKIAISIIDTAQTGRLKDRAVRGTSQEKKAKEQAYLIANTHLHDVRNNKPPSTGPTVYPTLYTITMRAPWALLSSNEAESERMMRTS